MCVCHFENDNYILTPEWINSSGAGPGETDEGLEWNTRTFNYNKMRAKQECVASSEHHPRTSSLLVRCIQSSFEYELTNVSAAVHKSCVCITRTPLNGLAVSRSSVETPVRRRRLCRHRLLLLHSPSPQAQRTKGQIDLFFCLVSFRRFPVSLPLFTAPSGACVRVFPTLMLGTFAR